MSDEREKAVKEIMKDPFVTIGFRTIKATLDRDVSTTASGSLISLLCTVISLCGEVNKVRLVGQGSEVSIFLEAFHLDTMDEVMEFLAAKQIEIVNELNLRLDGDGGEGEDDPVEPIGSMRPPQVTG